MPNTASLQPDPNPAFPISSSRVLIPGNVMQMMSSEGGICRVPTNLSSNAAIQGSVLEKCSQHMLRQSSFQSLASFSRHCCLFLLVFVSILLQILGYLCSSLFLASLFALFSSRTSSLFHPRSSLICIFLLSFLSLGFKVFSVVFYCVVNKSLHQFVTVICNASLIVLELA